MFGEQLTGPGRGITDPRVLAAMDAVPRDEFVPPPSRPLAYADTPLPIGCGQTISQPFIVAFMTQALAPKPSDRVLEIGTGCGYQAAVLSRLVAVVCTMEIIDSLARRAEEDLRRLGYANVRVRVGDGFHGWPEAAPFDAILVTCAPDRVPPPLLAQLKTGGRMVIPTGREGAQELCVLEKRGDGLARRSVMPVRFVPMTGAGVRAAGGGNFY